MERSARQIDRVNAQVTTLYIDTHLGTCSFSGICQVFLKIAQEYELQTL